MDATGGASIASPTLYPPTPASSSEEVIRGSSTILSQTAIYQRERDEYLARQTEICVGGRERHD